jgi:Tfp pilus assembly protein PilV
MLETIIGVAILVVAVLGAKAIFARNGSTSSQPKTGGGSVPDETKGPINEA